MTARAEVRGTGYAWYVVAVLLLARIADSKSRRYLIAAGIALVSQAEAAPGAA